MRTSILNTATTEQMGCIIFSFFVYTKSEVYYFNWFIIIFFIVFMFFLFSGRKKVQIVLRFNLAKRLFIDIFLQSTNNDMDLYIIEFGG